MLEKWSMNENAKKIAGPLPFVDYNSNSRKYDYNGI